MRTKLFLIGATTLLFSLTTQAEMLLGRVVGVHDGDTLTLLDHSNQQYKIRLMGIDAPELGQPYSRDSRDRLAQGAMHHEVRVEWHKQDRYGRIVGQVWLDHEDLNLAQIQAGLAWHYKKYEREQAESDRRIYSDTENRARTEGIGLWRDSDSIAPWDWRKSKRNK